ncbi:zinc finger protein OZF-like [Chrysoperla carnea]|uniref:zinc finger protein OZF-like n=1 Tax=Chrysoperla carnea TaxID=189513 RepID=UPI001D05D76B|nr:zinc finger protein OZF-like [Chrysoperla carnea]
MNTECVLVTDFERVCRICMEFADNLLSITSFKIIEMISSCTSVQIWENDELPNQICNTCFLQLQNTVTFKQLCEKSDSTFRQIIEQTKVKIENKTENFEFGLKTDDSNDNISKILQPDFTDVKVEHHSDDSDFDYNKDDDLSNHSFKSDVKLENTKSEEHDSDNDSEDDDKNGPKQVYKCEKCNQEFKKACNLGNHMHRRHRAKGTKCSKCSLVCYHPLHLSAHEKIHSPSNFPCKVCNKSFSNTHKLKRHKFIHGERNFACTKCDLSFKDKWILKRHVKTVHYASQQYEACHVCGKSFKKRHFQKHLATHGDRVIFKCEICLKEFLHKHNLDQHIKYVHENIERERNHLCNICGRGFHKMDDLRRHFLTHTKEKPYACDKCDKKYRTKYALTTHISRTHLNERNHICTFCSRAFYDKKILRNHVRTHTGEKPYQCHVCEKSFIQKVALTIHMKVHTNSI